MKPTRLANAENNFEPEKAATNREHDASIRAQSGRVVHERFTSEAQRIYWAGHAAGKADAVESCAAIAENPGFIQARDTEWDEGVNYAKRFIAAAIRRALEGK